VKISFIRSRSFLALVGLTLLASGCASLNSVSMTQVPKDRSNRIEESVNNWAFLGIYFSNDFVDSAIQRLKEKCPRGKITGVFTKYEGYLYFLVTKRVVNVSAYCEVPTATKTASVHYDKKN
jgi:hypothetical protein